MSLHRLIFFLITWMCLSVALAQPKFERESRMSIDEVPSSSLDVIQHFPFDGKIRWYIEQGIDQISIEAKTKWKDRRYSVEFDRHGVLEDVEIEIEENEIPDKVQIALHTYLGDHFDKYKIRKVQLQMVGAPTELKLHPFALMEESSSEVQVRYEIVIKVQEGKSRYSIELLTNEAGSIERQSTILQDNTDILEY